MTGFWSLGIEWTSRTTIGSHCRGPSVVLTWFLFLTSIGYTRSFFHLLSRGQILFLSRSEAVQLECEFYTEQFHLFDNPILWRKSQLRESTQMNMMGNMIEPFASTGRFKVIFLQEPPRYTLRLSIQNVSSIDSGNYTCEINGPHNALLGIVTHTIYVKVPATLLRLTAGNNDNKKDNNERKNNETDNEKIQQLPLMLMENFLTKSSPVNNGVPSPLPSSSSSSSSSPSSSLSSSSEQGTIALTDSQPTRLLCLALAALPEIQLSVYLDQRDITNHFRRSSGERLAAAAAASSSGAEMKGLRTIEYLEIRWTDEFVAKADDDGKLLRCVATVSGLTPTVIQTKLIVHYAPLIDCQSTVAFVDDKNVFVGCVVRARPWVTSLYWVIDVNGTTITSGQVVSEYWTLVMDRSDGSLETQLYMRQVKADNFRSYRLIAENSVAFSSGQVDLIQKFRSTTAIAAADAVSIINVTPVARYSKDEEDDDDDDNGRLVSSGSGISRPHLPYTDTWLLLLQLLGCSMATVVR